METPETMKGPVLQPSVSSADNPEPPSSSESASPYDMSLIPETCVFFPPSRPSVARLTSPAETIVKPKGIYSHDPLLDHNPEELWRFLASHLQAPHMAVSVEGTRMVSTSDGRNMNTYTVTDFSIRLDVSTYVNPQWSRIFTKPSRKARRHVATPTVRETLEEYARSKNVFKEFRLGKVVELDYEELKKSLKELVRSAGYRSTVSVTFPMQDYKVVALASSKFTKAAHSNVIRVLCCVSCLCLVFWPAWAVVRKRMKNRLICEYGMAASWAEFYAKNQGIINDAVVQRLKREIVTAL